MKRFYNPDDFKLIYSQYKDLLIPFATLVAGIFLVIYFIIPQFNNFLTSRNQVAQENIKLKNLKTQLDYLTSMDDNTINSEYNILTNALPSEKAYDSILAAVYVASGKSGVSLGDFSFKVGELKDSQKTTTNLNIDLNLSVLGTVQGVADFLEELQKTAPVNQIVSVSTSSRGGQILVRFYYQPLPPVNLIDGQSVIAISPKEQKIIAQIAGWNNLQNQESVAIPQGTISGSFRTNPFQ